MHPSVAALCFNTAAFDSVSRWKAELTEYIRDILEAFKDELREEVPTIDLQDRVGFFTWFIFAELPCETVSLVALREFTMEDFNRVLVQIGMFLGDSETVEQLLSQKERTPEEEWRHLVAKEFNCLTEHGQQNLHKGLAVYMKNN